MVKLTQRQLFRARRCNELRGLGLSGPELYAATAAAEKARFGGPSSSPRPPHDASAALTAAQLSELRRWEAEHGFSAAKKPVHDEEDEPDEDPDQDPDDEDDDGEEEERDRPTIRRSRKKTVISVEEEQEEATARAIAAPYLFAAKGEPTPLRVVAPHHERAACLQMQSPARALAAALGNVHSLQMGPALATRVVLAKASPEDATNVLEGRPCTFGSDGRPRWTRG